MWQRGGADEGQSYGENAAWGEGNKGARPREGGGAMGHSPPPGSAAGEGWGPEPPRNTGQAHSPVREWGAQWGQQSVGQSPHSRSHLYRGTHFYSRTVDPIAKPQPCREPPHPQETPSPTGDPHTWSKYPAP